MDSKDHSEKTDEFNSLRTYLKDEITKKSDDLKSEIKLKINDI